ncbi:unnamed protein product [Brugia pahangi]|uniref:Ammonium_transp domain-containing protein n=1 Tax=Brugia pahangi TaxID=6280 RepID=A0A0N4TDQ4_BRUPA|nr:unnamed protein product [Brugia pahangi]
MAEQNFQFSEFQKASRIHKDFDSPRDEGWAYANFLFQLSFATTSSTIVSGAVAERAKLRSYILLGCIVILIQALPSHWVWDSQGVFFKLGVVDFAGCSCVIHLLLLLLSLSLLLLIIIVIK